MDAALLDTEWIWHPNWEDHGPNTAGRFCHFRKFITLDTVPSSEVKIQITADTKYQLYINSVLVHTGPVKGDQHLWFYDELDIQPYLRPGKNHIGVRVLRFFHATKYATSFPRLPIPGLFVRTPGGDDTHLIIKSDDTWETALDNSTKFRIDQPEDDFLHLYEDVDASKQLGHSWVPAQPLRLPKSHGIAPPWVLSPRMIPFQTGKRVGLEAIHNIKSPLPGKTWESLLLENAPERTPLTLPAGSSHHLELQGFHHLTAMLRFQFQRPTSAGSKIRITYSESYEDVPRFVPYLRCKSDRTDTNKKLYGPQDQYIFAGQVGAPMASSLAYDAKAAEMESFAPLHFRTFRFLTLDIDVTPESDLVMTGIDVTTTNYPLDVCGSFSTPGHMDEEKYQNVWNNSVRTLTNCMHDCYEDCPFYEQLQYAMDVRSSCLFTYAASGDDRMARQAIVQLHNSYRPGIGLLASRGPAHQLQIIPHFSLFWICTVTDHFEHAGDASFTRQFLSTCDGILEAFARRIDPNLGVVSSTAVAMSSFWDFVDWTEEWRPMGIPPAAKRTGFQTFTSFLYAYTLRAAAGVVAKLGRPSLAEEYLHRAEGVVQGARAHCRAGNVFTDGLASSADHDKDFSQHNQIWAVLSGAVSGTEARDLLTTGISGISEDGQTAGAFTKPSMAMSFYTLRALSAAGGILYDAAFHGFWDPWRAQLGQNLTTWCEDEVTKRSDCHAWSCAPLYEFMAEVAGVRPAEPGWAVVGWRPRVGLFPDFAGVVPLGGMLAPGEAKVSWAREGGKLSLSIILVNVPGDGNVSIRIGLPDGRVEDHLGPSVSLEFREEDEP
ncbi:bacterial alpha-L-rhamnosidase-domain-containing protein [Plectosphaerella plurivora]|uniref:Bacterial alpha-L-rhamnosidase-domain-containing protein n=1 Tax=Plectosphaerella plurivora TaxID=936078 RepID=A0A9P8V0A8_9PEZI|nr:bacterial alpha-L-rhamnosidase-domain-containing protein [Plectosphaerella plurivora]